MRRGLVEEYYQELASRLEATDQDHTFKDWTERWLQMQSDVTVTQMAQKSKRIVREVHDEPHIKGRRVTVRHIHARVHGRGLRPETVADRLNLDIADVYHALAYYHDHPEEMAEVKRQREKVIEAAREETVISPPDDE
jgi:uncharacterized protein (DUF433 family)